MNGFDSSSDVKDVSGQQGVADASTADDHSSRQGGHDMTDQPVFGISDSGWGWNS